MRPADRDRPIFGGSAADKLAQLPFRFGRVVRDRDYFRRLTGIEMAGVVFASGRGGERGGGITPPNAGEKYHWRPNDREDDEQEKN